MVTPCVDTTAAGEDGQSSRREVNAEGHYGALWSSVKRLFFFFQAEDGIRDIGVTGVQTCALPICPRAPARRGGRAAWRRSAGVAEDQPARNFGATAHQAPVDLGYRRRARRRRL